MGWGAVFIIILPALAQCVGGFEGRFATSIYFMYFGYLVFLIDWKKFCCAVKNKPFFSIAVALIIAMLLLSTWSVAYAAPNYGKPIIF